MKSRKLILTAHCVLNQNSVLEGWGRARGAFPIIQLLIDEGIGILQLPCPELLAKGLDRPPLAYSDYNTSAYRNLCQELLIPYLKQLTEYLRQGYSLIGIIGIHQSPSCSISGIRGVLMEELFQMCQQHKITLKYVEIPEHYQEYQNHLTLENELKQLIADSNI